MTTQRISALFLAASMLLAAGCELDVVPNRDSVAEASAIHGTVRVDGALYGAVYLMLYSCEDPPPPAGSGSPVDFVVLPRTDFTDRQADFVFPLVVAGEPGTADTEAGAACYLVGGFVDSDNDFNPFFNVTAQVTAGDIGGSAVMVTVPGAPIAGEPIPLVEGVVVELATPVPFDRPSFEVWPTHVSSSAGPCGTAVDEGSPLGLAVGKDTEYPGPYDLVCATMEALPLETSLVNVDTPLFGLVFAADGDGDNLPDDLNGDTIPDVIWPKVLLQRLDTTDPNLLTTQDPPILIPAIVLPQDLFGDPAFDYLYAYLISGQPLDGETVVPVDHLNLLIPELMVTDATTLATETLENVAATGMELSGLYQILVMNSTGQVWSTPNELAAFGVESQAQVMIVE
jgi:hypothetical protein